MQLLCLFHSNLASIAVKWKSCFHAWQHEIASALSLFLNYSVSKLFVETSVTLNLRHPTLTIWNVSCPKNFEYVRAPKLAWEFEWCIEFLFLGFFWSASSELLNSFWQLHIYLFKMKIWQDSIGGTSRKPLTVMKLIKMLAMLHIASRAVRISIFPFISLLWWRH